MFDFSRQHLRTFISVTIFLTSVDIEENGKTTTIKSFDFKKIKITVEKLHKFDDDYYKKKYPRFFKSTVLLKRLRIQAKAELTTNKKSSKVDDEVKGCLTRFKRLQLNKKLSEEPK